MDSFDIVVVGAGIVGTTLANLLGRGGFSVALVEAREPAVFDPAEEIGLRVSAISPGVKNIWEQAGAWSLIEQQRHCVYEQMQVEQAGTGRLRFAAAEFGLAEIGYIIENAAIQSCLWKTAQQQPLISRYCPDKLAGIDQNEQCAVVHLSSGARLQAGLVCGADGAFSGVRQALCLDAEVWHYNQKGLVSVVQTEQPNSGIAWQRFLDTGPLAFLPLHDGRSSIVWSLPTAKADALLAMDSEQFGEELSLASNAWLGAVVACGARAAFPLGMQMADQLVSGRGVLLGDAANVVHPLAGQGVNIGLLDAAGLAETLIQSKARGEAFDSPAVLRRFERWRLSDSRLLISGIHGIKELFSLGGAVPSVLRGLGMTVVDKSFWLKQRFLHRACAIHADAPLLARGGSIASLLRPD